MTLVSIGQIFAQCEDPNVYCMNTGLSYACEGTFMDAGGSGPYPAESAVLTICSALENHKVSINFTEFDLYGGIDVLNSDQLIIFDGTSENDPLIGIYSGNDLAGQTIEASNGNPSGCLMVQFISGGQSEFLHSGWNAQIACVAGCDQPTAAATVPDATLEENIYLNCLYNEITLSAAGSSAAPGHTINSYEWDLMDGNTQSSETSDIVHQYNSAAIYDVHLTVIDDIGCAGETVIHVGMIGAPILDITDAQSVCIGTELNLTAAYTPSSINNSPQLQNNIALFVPDDQTQSFQTEIMVTGYQAGSSINSCEDIESVFVNMEHSFMGDLEIKLICPNGQFVILHQQGGDGTYLGEPVDMEDTTPGVGYTYHWSDNSTNGTWADSAFELGQTTLPEGTYQPIEPLCNLIGCPLNGIWALEVSDLWSVDNGYVFSWGLGMSVGNNIEALVYNSSIDENSTDSFWSGSDILSTNENADEASINTTEIGPLDLTYTTIDNIGCTYVEVVELDVIENPINITLDDYFVYALNNTSISAINEGTLDYYQLNWQWTPADGLSNPEDSYSEVFIPNDNETYTVVATANGYLGCSDSETIALTLPELTISGHIFLDQNQNGIFDNDEQPLPYFPYYMNNNAINSFSDQNGAYNAYCEYGSNTVSFSVDPSLWIITTPSSYTTILDDNETESLNNDFGIYPSSNPQTILNGSISNSNTWCVLNDVQTITVSNDGNTIESGYIIYTYDPACTLVSSSPEPYLVDGNNLYYAFDNLFYASSVSYAITLDMPDDAAGDELYFSVQTFYYEGETAIPVGTDPLVTTVVCSYDPNDKREFNGVGEMGLIAPNTALDYVIRFQNTGNAPALDVVITDQLPATLDFNSLQPVASSHPFVATITMEGLATFNFDNILLPDSTTDFEGSIGFIHFRIDQNADLPIGTVIHNHASIYFDMNEAIETNATTNTIMICTGEPLDITLVDNQITINDLVNDVQWYLDDELLTNAGYVIEATQTGNYYAVATLADGCPATSPTVFVTSVDELPGDVLAAYPNPAKDFVTINLPDGNNSISLINQLGQRVKQFNNATGNYQINVMELSRGIYTIRVENGLQIFKSVIVLD